MNLTPEQLKEWVAALAPGLLILGIRQRFTAARVGSVQERLIAYAAVSVVYYAIATPILDFAELFVAFPKWLRDFFEYALAPITFGVLLGAATSQDWFRVVWKLLRIQIVHEVPTAWDYVFSRLRHPVYVIATLKDGAQIGGLYGEISFASSDSLERDLLIEEVWDVQDNTWTKTQPPKSVLLCGRDLRAVEFLRSPSNGVEEAAEPASD